MILWDVKQAFLNLHRNPRRTLLTAGASAICVIVVTSIGGFYNRLFQNIQEGLRASNGDMVVMPFVRETKLTDYEAITELIETQPEVENVFPRMSFGGVVGFGDRSAVFSGDAANDRTGDRAVTGVSIGRRLAATLHAGPGDTLNFILSDGLSMRGASFPVAAVEEREVSQLDRVAVRISFTGIQELLDVRSVDSLHVVLSPGADAARIKADLTERLLLAGFTATPILGTEVGGAFPSIRNVYMNNYYFVLAVVGLTLVASLFNTLSLNIRERSAEIGTLRSFGMPGRRITRLVVLESLALGLMGSAAAVPLSLIIGWIINARGGIYMPPPPTVEHGYYAGVSFTVGTVLFGVGLNIVTSFVAAHLCSIRSRRHSIMEDLTYA